MSRIGKQPVALPKGVTIDIGSNNIVTVKGPKGTLTRAFVPDMDIAAQGAEVIVTRPTDQRHHRALHGLTRALLQNMVTGVSAGFTKEMELVGVGYKAAMQGKALELNLGYSHPVVVPPPANISFEVDRTGRLINVQGIDKEQVGEVAAKLRALRKPEPYKGKGIRYKGEFIKIKAGTSSKGKK